MVMTNPNPQPQFFDPDIACLLSNLAITDQTCVQAAVFFQVISRLIRKSGKKSILVTIPGLHKEHFPYLSESATKRNLQRLRRLGILRTRVEYKGLDHHTRVWINEKRIIELAEEVQEAQEEAESWERIKKGNGSS